MGNMGCQVLVQECILVAEKLYVLLLSHIRIT